MVDRYAYSGHGARRAPWRFAWLLWVACIFFGCGAPQDAPRAQRGVLDARRWHFAEQGTLPLSGEWEFYWQQDLTPQQLASSQAPRPMYVPLGGWAQLKQNGKRLPREGYATYRLRVHLPPDTRILAFESGPAMTASVFYLDGERLLQSGRLARSAAQAEPRIRPIILDYAPRGDTLEIVVRVSNFDYLPGGLRKLSIGLPRDIYGARDSRYAAALLLCGAILIMGLYHAGLYALRRKEPAALYFACICGTCTVFAFSSGDMFILHVWPSLPGQLWWKLFVGAWYVGALFLLPLVRSLFPDEFHVRLLRPHCVFMGGMVVLMLVTPIRVYLRLDPITLPYTVLIVSYSLWVTSRAIRARRPGARLMLAGFAVLLVTLVHDMLVATQTIASRAYLTPLGIFIFILLQSVLLAQRFSKAFDMVEASERARTLFFQNTSHELRTPLNGILGFIELLRRGHYGPLELPARGVLDKVTLLTESLRNQVNTILDLAKSKQGKLSLVSSPVQLNRVVYELRALADGLSLKGEELGFEHSLSWDPEHDDPLFVTDRDKLLTVLRNLIGNAFKFRAPGKPHHVSLRLALEQGVLCIEVQDTGIGIPEDQRDRVFEEFVQVQAQASRAYEGTGLGLPMVKSFVALMGGTLELSSELGVGSTFRIRLPEQQITEAVRTATTSEPAPPWLRPLLSGAAEPRSGVVATGPEAANQEILVVDDNATNLEVMRELLRSAGYPVVSSSGGREALERMRQQRPDLVLLDLMMPEVSGEDVLREVRRDPALRDLPVILLTARASQEDRLFGLHMGADDYLAKPVDSGELLLRVRNTLGRASLIREKVARDQHLEAARAVQEALLPLGREFPGVGVEDHYCAAQQTGGDWFGYGYDQQTSRFYVALGDVTGHGMPAALVTGAAAGAFRASLGLLAASTQPMEITLGKLASAMNDAVGQTGARARRLMTMAFVCLDLSSGEGCYINAGHGPVYLFGGLQPRVLLNAGRALGSEPSPEHVPLRFRLASGEGLFMHSDGLLENEGPDGRALSARKLQKLLQSERELSSLKRIILREGEAVWREQSPEDDCCFVLVRFRPDEASHISRQSAG